MYSSCDEWKSVRTGQVGLFIGGGGCEVEMCLDLRDVTEWRRRMGVEKRGSRGSI